MKTLVYQSFRTQNVPVWINTCMASVQAWCASRQFSYEFIDDRFFNCVPVAFRERVRGQRHLMADIARLEWATTFFDKEWHRVIWIDADVFICDPQHFLTGVNDKPNFFCRELWINSFQGKTTYSHKVNNSVMAFSKSNPFLDSYKVAAYERVASCRERLQHTAIGTDLLTELMDQLPLIQSVAMCSPQLLVAFYNKDKIFLDDYVARLGAPIHAANLCLTFRNTHQYGVQLTDSVFDAVIETLRMYENENTTQDDL